VRVASFNPNKALLMKLSSFRFTCLLLAMFFPTPGYSSPANPVVPSHQQLMAVDYTNNGKQTGCGLRATGDAESDLRLNVLVTVFAKGSGATFGVIKVVARKVVMQDGMPLAQGNNATYLNLGEISNAWIVSDSGKQAMIYTDGESSHNDAYMVNAEFTSTLNLMTVMSQEDFKVGLKRKTAHQEQIFQFNQRASQEEAGKLSVCLNKLRQTIMDERHQESF